jgi:ethanolamine ammonia-lyase small subunit
MKDTTSLADHAPKHALPADPWASLKVFTDARIAIGRAGVGIPVGETLSFRLSHARARDAVHTPFEAGDISEKIAQLGVETILVESAAQDRAEYLTRPDLGRKLSIRSAALLEKEGADSPGFDLAMVVGDGLSSRAIHENSVPFLADFLPLCRKAGITVAPVCVASQSRVALGDAVGQRLKAKVVAILIGERPGLSSPDSMGIYMTWAPKEGTTDEARNCISNVRSAGLPTHAAAVKLAYLLGESLVRKLSGVNLKDNQPEDYLPFSNIAGYIA